MAGNVAPSAASSAAAMYVHVVDDVIEKVRDEFVSYGLGDAVLRELQELWEEKMKQCGVISGDIDRSSIPKASSQSNPVHDLNVPYEGLGEEYETPTADMLFPPTPLQTPMQTPMDQSVYNIPTGSSDYAPSPMIDVGTGAQLKPARPPPHMPPPSPWMYQRPMGVDVNVAYEEGHNVVDRESSRGAPAENFTTSSGKRKVDDYTAHLGCSSFMPQQDGSVDVSAEIYVKEVVQDEFSSRHPCDTTIRRNMSYKDAGLTPVLPQHDGSHDEYDDLFRFQGVQQEDYNTPGGHELRAPTPAAPTPGPSGNNGGDDDEPPLNEDDDDEEDLDDDEQDEEEPSTQHLILAQFEKVTRTKNRWKCTLKDGIMHLNGRDILFNKANGEFEF